MDWNSWTPGATRLVLQEGCRAGHEKFRLLTLFSQTTYTLSDGAGGITKATPRHVGESKGCSRKGSSLVPQGPVASTRESVPRGVTAAEETRWSQGSHLEGLGPEWLILEGPGQQVAGHTRACSFEHVCQFSMEASLPVSITHLIERFPISSGYTT